MLNENPTVTNENTEEMTLDQVIFTWDEPYEELEFFAERLAGKLSVKNGGNLVAHFDEKSYPITVKLSDIDVIYIRTATIFSPGYISIAKKLDDSDKLSPLPLDSNKDWDLLIPYSKKQSKQLKVFIKAATKALSKYGIEIEVE